MPNDSAVTRMDRVREQALVARSRTDASAFGELYDYYLPRLHGFVLRRAGDRSVAEDVTATTFERALQVLRRGDFRNESFGGWLYRVAANALVDHVRHARRMVPLGVRAGDGWDAEEAPGASVAADQVGDAAADAAFAAALDRDQLARALLRLPEPHRRLIVLRFFDGLEVDELCTLLACSRTTLAVRLHRALRALRTLVAAESTDAA
jgi:RNA polymerase sigma-70 factor (ECF subfamily)